MFWIAWPAPPLIRLSIAREARRSSADRRPASLGPPRSPPRRGSSPPPRPPPAAAWPAAARTARARTARRTEPPACRCVDARRQLEEAGREDAARQRRRDRHEPQLQALGARVGEQLHDLRDVLVLERLVRLQVRPRGSGDACPRPARCPSPTSRVMPVTCTTAPSSRPARASGRSASSIVVAKQPGDATYFACLICARGSPPAGHRRTCRAGPGAGAWRRRTARTPPRRGAGSRRTCRRSSRPRRAAPAPWPPSTLCGSAEQRHVAAARRLGRREILELEIRRAVEVRVHRAERLAHVVDRRHARQLDVRVHEQPPRELCAAIAAAADDRCLESLRHRGPLCHGGAGATAAPVPRRAPEASPRPRGQLPRLLAHQVLLEEGQRVAHREHLVAALRRAVALVREQDQAALDLARLELPCRSASASPTGTRGSLTPWIEEQRRLEPRRRSVIGESCTSAVAILLRIAVLRDPQGPAVGRRVVQERDQVARCPRSCTPAS